MQLATIILGILKTRKGKIHNTELMALIVQHFTRKGIRDIPSEKEIHHTIDLLVDDGHVIKTNNGAWEEFQISSKGYARLKAWYAPKKMLSIMSNDVAKVLSIVATILSILATYFSIRSRF